jgi:hypothetical protein
MILHPRSAQRLAELLGTPVNRIDRQGEQRRSACVQISLGDTQNGQPTTLARLDYRLAVHFALSRMSPSVPMPAGEAETRSEDDATPNKLMSRSPQLFDDGPDALPRHRPRRGRCSFNQLVCRDFVQTSGGVEDPDGHVRAGQIDPPSIEGLW